MSLVDFAHKLDYNKVFNIRILSKISTYQICTTVAIKRKLNGGCWGIKQVKCYLRLEYVGEQGKYTKIQIFNGQNTSIFFTSFYFLKSLWKNSFNSYASDSLFVIYPFIRDVSYIN